MSNNSTTERAKSCKQIIYRKNLLNCPKGHIKTDSSPENENTSDSEILFHTSDWQKLKILRDGEDRRKITFQVGGSLV